ncbi:hypothetical protein C8J95_10849 [Elizabethkingia sp. YR214]|uniref:hypothetical protein n=1 Tax=Elizabethkingia sp. YR214 TaxID=2135667 RepID=UPI000D2F6282|nr:hypothetical protein [Elizabethkingia sp. YR214]PUB28105.1 hypothetical protein C8J95_10849 [Elizabethkingia sp. YR214]
MNNNQSSQTLFRFVSQRNAQLIESEEKITFINYPKTIKSVFDQAIIQWANQKSLGVTKLDALTAKAKELKQTQQIQLFTKADEVAVAAGSFYKAGKQLAVESKISSELEAELKAYFSINANGETELISTAPLNLVNIWDNFIYQVVTQESFYVKEALSQVLKAYNYIKNIIHEGVNKEEVLKQALDAKVVLPPVLFLDEYPVEQDHAFQVNVSNIGESYISAKNTVKAVRVSSENIELVNADTARKANALAANYYKENLRSLKKDLEKAKKSYDAGYHKAYKTALKEHQAALQNSDRLLQASAPENFSFEYGVSPTDTSFLSTKLSESSLQALVMLMDNDDSVEISAMGLRESDTINSDLGLVSEEYENLDGIIAVVDEQIHSYNKQINDNTVVIREEYTSIGGVLVPVAGNLVASTGDTKSFTATTVAKNNTEWSVLLEFSDKTLSVISANYQASVGIAPVSDSSAVFVQDGIYKLFGNNAIPVNNSGSNGFTIQGEVVLSDNKVYQLNFTMIISSYGDKDYITNAFPYTGSGGLYIIEETPEQKVYEGEVCASNHPSGQNIVAVSAYLKIPSTTLVNLGEYRLMNGGEVVKSGHVQDWYVTVNNVIQLHDLFDNTLTLHELQQSTKFVFDASISGKFQQLVLENFNTLKCATGIFKDAQKSNEDSDGQVFIPKGFGIRRLGIADYLKVEQSTHAYVEGEVANIENIMAREYRDKSTRRLRRSENTTTTSKETEQEKLTDTTTATRFEMQTEIARMLQESNDSSVSTSSGFSKWGANFNIASAYANHRSKEESTRQATTQAQDITQRAMDRVVSKVREERIEKIVEEFEENNSHGFDNRKGDKHVVGVYRWVDKLMKNQIFNYGKRMMFEFMVPQPSNIHNLASSSIKTARVISKPIDPRTYEADLGKKLDSYEKINATTISFWGSMYSVDLMNLSEEISIGKAFSFEVIGDSNEDAEWDEIKSENVMLPIPEGFEAYMAKVYAFGPMYKGEQVVGIHTIVGNYKFDTSSNSQYQNIGSFVDAVPVSYSQMGYHTGSINIDVKCRITNLGKIKAYNAIIGAYEEAMVAYNQAIAEEEARAINIKETNANFYRQIEQDVLKHNCIAYMVDPNLLGTKLFDVNEKSLETYEVIKKKILDDYAALVKFMEQAFEWDIMSYNFYPYFWGNKADWKTLYQSESIDPLFRSFLQSGMARVVATVRPGFEDAVQFYMSTGKIWSGGEVPVIGDPLYLSIVNEMREPMGEKYGKAWITRIPTSLTILQAESIGLKVEHALPFTQEDSKDFEDPKALITESNFEKNDATMQAPDSKMVGNMEINNDYIQLTTKDDPKQVVAQLSLDNLKEALQ